MLPLLAPSGRYGIVAFSQERQPAPSDAEILASGDITVAMPFLREDLVRIFSALDSVEVRSIRPNVDGTFGPDFLNAGLLRS